jgi:hypothetical protein
MNQFLLVLIFIIVVITILYIRNAAKIEGFEDNSTPVDKTFFNTINNLFNPVKPHPLTPTEINQVSQAIQTTNQPYISSAYEKGSAGERVQTGALYESSDALKKAQTICEIIVPGAGSKLDCNAFDNAQFNQFCGMSFDLQGTNSKGTTHVGGLYIDPTAKASYPSNGVYNPTYGTSSQFAINKATCQFMQNDIDCKNLTNPVGTKNCSKCFSDNSLHAVVDNVPVAQPTFTLYTNATNMTLKVAETNTTYTLLSNSSTIPVTAGVTSTSGPTANGIVFKTVNTGPINITEGQNFTITASISSGASVAIAGFLQGATHQGLYSIDLNAIVDTDNDQTPSVGGDVNGYLQINQIYGASNIKLHGLMTFSFINPTAFDSINCQNGPFITKAGSLTYLETNEPCYAADASPGHYSLACLQKMFSAVGGTTSGSGYPNTADKARVLNIDDNGNNRTLADIGNFLYQKSVLAATGLEDGQSVSIERWNSWSMFMTGRTITNPCQTTRPGAPVSVDCQKYLFTQSRCPTPGTYNPDPTVKNCTNSAGAAIVCPPNPTVTTAAAAGNKDAITTFYATAYAQTNDTTLSNSAKAASVLGCTGVNLLQ